VDAPLAQEPDKLEALQARIAELLAENASLRQQLADLTA